MKSFTGQFLTVPTLDPSISDSHSSENVSLSPCSDLEMEGDFFEPSSDTDAISTDTKKIRKKRTAYQKIDDDIRLELLDAVQKKGESLKSASKRLNINYSSAKSILHTFRKEGRILKKNALEKNIRVTTYPATMAMDMSPVNEIPQFIADSFPKIKVSFSDASLIQQTPDIPSLKLNEHRTASPMKGLADTFSNLFVANKETSSTFPNIPNLSHRVEPQPQPQSYHYQQTQFTRQQYRTNLQPQVQPEVLSQYRAEAQNIPRSSIAPNFSSIFKMMPQAMECSPLNQVTTPKIGTPLEGLKHLDSFYMNYSNSPLSGGGPNIYKETSNTNTGSKSAFNKEFDSFSEMISAIQGQPKVAVVDGDKENKGEFYIPKPVKQNSNIERTGNEENIDVNIMPEKESGSGKTQFLVDDALKRASQLNNKGLFQKSSGTPSSAFSSALI